MERNILNRVLVGVGLALVAGAVGLYIYRSRTATPPPPPPAAAAPQEAPPAVVENPLPKTAGDAAGAAPLPELAASDAPLAAELSTLFGAESVSAWLMPEMLIRRLVVTVDNMPRSKPADRLRPVKYVEGQFEVTRDTAATPGGDETITLADSNYARYDSVVRLISAADMQPVAKLYTRYYPLFQQSYEELGFPGKYFNDRLVAVIDHLLQTPEVSSPILLTQPKVFYQFADPSLEARSAGQKLLLRMGPRNAQAVKAKLRELRTAVAKP
ncbi:MAG TPA: DUF3014 domain-containing protein [Steroidobacteraceae bacterium]|nr:DUF3014 domain-containing protein [Steroidobacteraceae bacterium]